MLPREISLRDACRPATRLGTPGYCRHALARWRRAVGR